MTKYAAFFLLISIALCGCMWGETNKQKPDITTDTLVYTYRSIKERAADCGNKPDSGCTVAKIKYPIFAGEPILNDTIAKRIITLYSGGNPDAKPAKTIQQLAKDFITGYQTDNPKKYSADMFYTLTLTANVIRQDSSLSTLQLDGYNYEGGAHGSSTTTFINWNTKAKREIYLKDILTAGYNEQLTRIAETIFRHDEKLSDTASLARDYFFEGDKFALNENFSITPTGLRFLYNQYEIKPYAAGQTELSIPYTKIKTLLRPNTVITQYIK